MIDTEMFSQEAATRAEIREARKETREEDIRKVVKMLRTLNYGDGSILYG